MGKTLLSQPSHIDAGGRNASFTLSTAKHMGGSISFFEYYVA